MKTAPPYCFLLCIVFSTSACCHGYWVSLNNFSDTAKTVKVINVEASDLQHRNYVYTSNIYHPILFKNWGRHKLPIIKDSIERNYSFLLPKGEKVFLAGGLGGPEHKPEFIIVNNKDTIPMSGGNQTKRKEHWLTYTTSYTNILK